jgi:hypothetical protein
MVIINHDIGYDLSTLISPIDTEARGENLLRQQGNEWYVWLYHYFENI